MTYSKIFTVLHNVSIETVAVLLIVSFGFMLLEPTVGRSQTTDEFTVTQEITGAISFQQNADDVTMVGALDGLTGGTAYGTTSVRVRTNNSSGYNMTIEFSSTTAMIRDGSGATEILNYQYSTGTASYPTGFASANYAQFGFSVNASNTADVSTVFDSSGSTCGTGTGGSFVLNACWRGASTTDETTTTELLNTSAATPASGSTSTVQFRVTVPNNPTPAVPNGFYVATATLTITDN